MKFVVTQDAATGLWQWELRPAEGGAIARSTSGFKTLDQLMASLEKVRAKTSRALVFDLLGTLYDGV